MIVVSLGALVVNGGITLALIRDATTSICAACSSTIWVTRSPTSAFSSAQSRFARPAALARSAIGAAIGVLVLWSTWEILKESGNILLAFAERPRR